jgi:hypothetical protein
VLKYQARLDRVSRTAADRKKILNNRLKEATRAQYDGTSRLEQLNEL